MPGIHDKTVLVLKMGATYPDLIPILGDFDRWICEKLPDSVRSQVLVCDPSIHALPDPSGLSALIISGSHAMVTQPTLADRYALRWLELALQLEVPTLGICYGHQMLAQVLGGEVGVLADGPEIGLVPLRLAQGVEEDPLFGALPPTFHVAVAHYQGVLRLPPGALCFASSAREPHHAVRYLPWAWGVQFHPEFSGQALVEYVKRNPSTLVGQRGDFEAQKAKLLLWREPTELLFRFSEACISHAK